MINTGFNLAAGISPTAINKAISSFFEHGVIPKSFVGSIQENTGVPNLDIMVSYDLHLATPQVELPPAQPNTVRLSGGFNSKVKLCFLIGGRERCLLDSELIASFTTNVQMKTRRNVDHTYFSLDFESLLELEIDLGGSQGRVAKKYIELLERVLERVLLVNFRQHYRELPVTSGLARKNVGGWPVSNTAFKLANEIEPGAMIVALNTLPNANTGDNHKLKNSIGNNDFGVSIDENLILQTLDYQWRTGQIPTRYDLSGAPDPQGAIRVRTFNVSINDDKFHLSLNVIFETEFGNQELWLHANVGLGYSNNKFFVEISDEEIEFPWAIKLLFWIAFKITHIFIGLILNRTIGYVLGELLEDLLDSMLNSKEVKILYRGEIPGTGMEVVTEVADIRFVENNLMSMGNIDVRPTK